MSGLSRPLLLTLTCILLATGPPSGQAQDVRIGLQAGPAIGFLSDSATPFSGGTPRINANLRLNLQVGMHFIVPLTDHLALQPELRMLQKGGHFSRPLSESYTVERYQLSYLQGALLLRPSVPLPGPLSLHVVAGISADRALSGVAWRDFRSADLDFSDRISLQDPGQLRRWDVGGVLGVSVGYPVGPADRIALSLRYNPGFRSVFAQSGQALPGDQNLNGTFPLPPSVTTLRHDVVTAGLTYTIPLLSLF